MNTGSLSEKEMIPDSAGKKIPNSKMNNPLQILSLVIQVTVVCFAQWPNRMGPQSYRHIVLRKKKNNFRGLISITNGKEGSAVRLRCTYRMGLRSPYSINNYGRTLIIPQKQWQGDKLKKESLLYRRL